MSDKEVPPADPDDLDFTDDERVAEIDEGRYVVGTGGPPNVAASRSDPGPDDDSGFQAPAEQKRAAERDPTSDAIGGDPAGGSAEVDRRAVSRWLATSFDGDGFAYGFDATLHTEGDTTRHRMVSNDVTATFDTLVSWFANNAGSDASPSEALGLLLVASDTPVDLPPVAITRFAAREGLSADDSIGDLVRAAEEAGGLRIE
ncbi:hypothetical protein GRS48_02390 [Halorubrum sp. JWXQ-INN 858]|uniref:DUF7500 family protein n=1 Tax=Halorubrum sp. JWXQ-INN 858 TaxID=2690782 RepID=UPI00135AB07F|nr:hypothetical protein [Halorubrum sp. JWXQ-INN 858]MWV63677.1 hypothetical protein [Halorubrum sp. JWXQ-INN 858]